MSEVVHDAMLHDREMAYEGNRRVVDRYPSSRLIDLTPLDPATKQVVGDTISVMCCNLSSEGVGFYHTEPLTIRYGLIQLARKPELPRLVVRLVWCRFLKPDWYENGGQFLQVVSNSR